jgi:hypothetical protein
MKPWVGVILDLPNSPKDGRQGVGQGLQLAIMDSVPCHPPEMNIATSWCPAPISIAKNVRLRSSLTSSENVANDAVNLVVTTISSLRDDSMTTDGLAERIVSK